MKPQTSDIEAIIRQALAKYEAGRQRYGQLDLASDSRDFTAEAISELEDCINYCVFQIIRLKIAGIPESEFETEIKLRAERKAGELLKGRPMAKGTKGQFKGKDSSGTTLMVGPENITPPLAEDGISWKQSSRWQELAEIPETEFETEIKLRSLRP